MSRSAWSPFRKVGVALTDRTGQADIAHIVIEVPDQVGVPGGQYQQQKGGDPEEALFLQRLDG